MSAELRNALAGLADANAYRTTDLDAARQHIGALFVPHRLEVVGCRQTLDVCIGRARIEGLSLIYHRHGASVRVRPEPLRDFFLLQIPLRGEAYIKIDQLELCCNTKQAVMISPTAGVDMRFSAGCEQLIARIEKSDLERQLEAQLGRDLGAPLEFAPAVSLATPGAQQISALLRLITASVLDGEGMSRSAIARKHMVSLLLSGLLTCLDHNYRNELIRGNSRPKPPYIGKAQDFIHKNVREPIGPEEIAAAVHVSTRALYAGFGMSLNTTPMRYLKRLRLDLVRDSLAKLDPQHASVTTVAMEHGFQHLGHFCTAYKERFDELPHETLSKRCQPTCDFDSPSASKSDRGGAAQGRFLKA
jgi:AraC-like DNA-binding protein